MLEKLKRVFLPSTEELERRKQELRRRQDDKNTRKGSLSQPGITTLTELTDATTGPIVLTSAACPYCGVEQAPPPQRRKKCRDCMQVIHVRTNWKERKKYLLTAEQDRDAQRKERDTRWKELSQTIQSAMRMRDWKSLQSAYQQQADMLFHEGRAHQQVSIEATRAQLMSMQEIGIRSVSVMTVQDERVCEYCTALEGKVFDIEYALEQFPIPGSRCTDGSDKNPHGGRCRCIYKGEIPCVDEGA